MSECSIAIQILGQKFSGSCKLVPDEAESEKPGSHGVFRILDLRFFWAGGLDHHRHLTQRKAKLNVAFQFPSVKSASAFCGRVSKLEASELDCAVSEAGVVVEHMVAATVVMLVSAFVAVSSVPNVCKSIHRLRLSAVQLTKEFSADCVTIMVNAVSIKSKGRDQKAFVACHDVGKIAKALRTVFAQSDVDVYSTHMGGIAFRTFVAKVTDNLL